MFTPSLLSRDTSFLLKCALSCFALGFFFIGVSHASAATYYWVGSVQGSTQFENPANWAAVPRGAPGSTAPGAADTAILSYSGTTVQIRSAVLVQKLEINNVWTGSVLQGTGTISVGAGGMSMGSGRFIGGDAAINVIGAFALTGGIMTGIQNTLSVSGAVTITRPVAAVATTFTSTGTLELDGDAADQTITLATTPTATITNLTINNTAGTTSDDIIIAGAPLNLSGNLVITLGNLDMATNSLALNVDGNTTIASAAQATLTTDSNVNLAGNVTVGDDGIVTVTRGTWTFDGTADQTIDLDGQKINRLTINNSGNGSVDDIIMVDAGGVGLVLSGALTITEGNLDMTTNSLPLTVSGSITLASDADATLTSNSNITNSGAVSVGDLATITISAGTWTLDGSADQAFDVDGQALYSLTLNNIGAGTNDDIVVAGGNLDVNGNLTITLGNLDLQTNGLALDLEGNLTVADAAQATFTTDANVNTAGNITIGDASTLTVNDGTWTLDGTADQTVDFDSQQLDDLTINNSGAGSSDDIIISNGSLVTSGSLTITAGNLDLLSYSAPLAVSGSITLADAAEATLATASNITLSGSFTVNDAATISMSTGGTLTLDGGSADQTIDLDGQSIFNLTISNIQGGTADDIIIANNGQLNVMGALSITQGNLDLDTYNEPLTVSGGVTVTSHAQAAITTDANMTLSGAIAIGDDAVITVSGGTLTLQDDGDQAFDIDGQTLWNLTLNNRGAAADREVVLAGANLSVSGALTITRGNLDLTTNSLALDVDDGVTLADDAAAQLTSNSNITTSGSVSVGASALLALTGGTWTLNGDADQTVDFDDQPLFNLTINNSGGGSNDDITFSDGSLTMTGLLTVTAGHLDLATNSIAATISGGLTIANAAEATMITNGSVTLSGSITKGAAGTLTMSGSSNTWTIETVDATINVAAHPFYNLTITSRSGATLGAQTTVWSTLTVASGSTLSLDAYDLLLTGATIAINGKLDILSTGVPRHPGSTQFSDASYGVGGSVFVTVNAGDRNIDGLIAQTITGALTVGTDTEVITLTENGLATGVFRGSMIFANATATALNSSIETAATATSTFTFTDYVDGLVVTDTAILVVGGGAGSQNNREQRAADLLAASQAQQQEDSGGGGGGGGGGGPTGSTTPSTTTASATPTTTGTTGVTGTTGTSEAGGGTVTVSAPTLAQDDGRALRVMIDGKETTLRDVPTSTWFAPYVNVLVESGIVSGYRDARGNPTGEFGPANSVTYGEVAKMALKAAGMEPGGSPALRSAKGQWSAGYVAKLESLGVSVFKDDARLNVNSPAPRGAVIQTILEVFGQDIGSATGSAYSDVSARTEHAAAIEAATADGLVSGDDGKNTFRPASAINRAETAKVIQNAMSLYGN